MRYQDTWAATAELRQLMDLKALLYGIRLLIGAWAVCLATGAGAQESLDHGKSPAQLFASDCSICHKSPQGLAKSGGLLGLDSFLREHYTVSRESAIAIANYLKSMDRGPAAPGRASKRTAKGDEKAKADEKKKPAVKPGEAKSSDSKSSDSKSSDSKSSETKPADIVAPEPKPVESKPSAPATDEAKPAGGAKSEKSD
jgi:hypothetical protein